MLLRLKLTASASINSCPDVDHHMTAAGHGVLLGAGVCVLGPVEIGPGSKVGAGSVVVTDLPCHCVAVGVPARIIRQACKEEPSVNMDLVNEFLDYVI